MMKSQPQPKRIAAADIFDVVPVQLDGEEWWIALDADGKELCQPQRSKGAATDAALKR